MVFSQWYGPHTWYLFGSTTTTAAAGATTTTATTTTTTSYHYYYYQYYYYVVLVLLRNTIILWLVLHLFPITISITDTIITFQYILCCRSWISCFCGDMYDPKD